VVGVYGVQAEGQEKGFIGTYEKGVPEVDVKRLDNDRCYTMVFTGEN